MLKIKVHIQYKVNDSQPFCGAKPQDYASLCSDVAEATWVNKSHSYYLCQKCYESPEYGMMLLGALDD